MTTEVFYSVNHMSYVVCKMKILYVDVNKYVILYSILQIKAEKVFRGNVS